MSELVALKGWNGMDTTALVLVFEHTFEQGMIFSPDNP